MSFYDSLHKMTTKDIHDMEFMLEIYRVLKHEEANNLRKLSFFTQPELTEMMLVVSGSSTSLPQAKIDEINEIFIELKQFRDALSLIEKINGKQQNKEPLTMVEQIFNEYFYMVSELLTMYKMLGDGNDNDNMLNTMWSVNQRDSFQLREYLRMRISVYSSWFSNIWTDDFLRRNEKSTTFPEKRGNRKFDDSESRKMCEVQQEQTEFHELHNLENTSLNRINRDLSKKMEDHKEKLNVPTRKSMFLLELKDILDFLKLSEEEQHRKMIELKEYFDEMMPTYSDIYISYTSFVERCRAMTSINQQYMKHIEQNDEVVALYQFCKNKRLPFPGIQNEGDVKIPIPPKGERTDVNMYAYHNKRRNEWTRMESKRIELEKIERERKMKETSSK